MGSSLYTAAGSTTVDHPRTRWIFGAIAVVPPLMLLAPNALVILALVAFAVASVGRGEVASFPVRTRGLDALGVVGALFLASALVTTVTNFGGAEGLVALGRFMLVPAAFLALRGAARHDLRGAVWLGAVIGAIAAGSLALGLVLLADTARPTSFVNPIHFGELALVLGFVATVTRGLAPGDPRVARRVTLVAIGAAVTASVLAQSRGSWLAVPAIVVVALVHHHRCGSPRTLRYTAALVLALVPVMWLAAMANDRAAVRAFDRGFDQTVEYVITDGADDTGGTSVGARFEMWRSAFAGFRGSPLVGIGWGNMDQRFAEDVRAGVRAERIAEHHHPHNQYLSHLGSGGLLGLTGLLALFAVPGWICLRAFRAADPSRRALGGAGLGVIAGYAVFSLTDSVLETASPLIFYVVMIGIVVAQLDRVESEQVFAYGGPHGLEQRERPVEGHRAGAL